MKYLTKFQEKPCQHDHKLHAQIVSLKQDMCRPAGLSKRSASKMISFLNIGYKEKRFLQFQMSISNEKQSKDAVFWFPSCAPHSFKVHVMLQ